MEEVWTKECIPEKWNVAEIVPISKKGDLTRPDNYRGISIINSALKIFTSTLARKLGEYIERYPDILGREQSAFRRYEETVSQTLALIEIIEQRKKMGLITHVAFLDLTKAYDKVPHSALLWRCKSILPRKLWNLVKALYVDLRFTVKQMKRPTGFNVESLPILCGVRQECLTSPILFSRDILLDFSF